MNKQVSLTLTRWVVRCDQHRVTNILQAGIRSQRAAEDFKVAGCDRVVKCRIVVTEVTG